MSKNVSTRSSLIRGLQSNEEWAWNRFFKLYHPLLLNWARRHRYSHAESEDLVAELVKNLFKRLGKFEYDRNKSFRGYLATALRRVAADTAKKDTRYERIFEFDEAIDQRSGASSNSILDIVCSAESEALLILAKRSVLNVIDEKERLIWLAMSTRKGAADELAREFGISRASVYRTKLRVSRQMMSRYHELSSEEL